MSDKNKRISNSAGVTSQIQGRKRAKHSNDRIDFNKYFTPNDNSLDGSSTFTGEDSLALEDITESLSNDSNKENNKNDSQIPLSKLMELFNNVSAVNQATVNLLKTACDTLRSYRTKSALGIRENGTTDDDLPLLELFQKYNLPLQTKEEVDELEAALDSSNDFLKFFVSSNTLRFYSISFAYSAVRSILIYRYVALFRS